MYLPPIDVLMRSIAHISNMYSPHITSCLTEALLLSLRIAICYIQYTEPATSSFEDSNLPTFCSQLLNVR